MAARDYRKDYSRDCASCGRTYHPFRISSTFCSRLCRGTADRKERIRVGCAECGKTMLRGPWNAGRRKRHFCSWDCKNRYQEVALRGKGNPNFKDSGWKRCVGCGDPFRSYQSRRRYCGLECSQQTGTNENMRNARRGADAERKCRKVLEGLGYIVVRSAASKSPWDLIAVGSKDVRLVQCKLTRRWRSFRPVIRDLAAVPIPSGSTVRQELWVWVQREGWRIQVV